MHFRRSTSLFALGAAASMLAMSAPAALAHDSVIGGNVVSDSPLQEFPEEITLEFSAVPRDDFNTFAVTDTKTGEVLFDAEPEIEQRELTIEVPDDVKPGPGEYQVGFQITSSDGHATRGSVPFSVAGSADGAAGDAADGDDANDDAAKQDETNSEGLPPAALWALGIVGVLAIVAVVIMAGAKMRRANDLDS
ncbi:copper resistance CopC family protein [Corynebacterium simulans]